MASQTRKKVIAVMLVAAVSGVLLLLFYLPSTRGKLRFQQNLAELPGQMVNVTVPEFVHYEETSNCTSSLQSNHSCAFYAKMDKIGESSDPTHSYRYPPNGVSVSTDFQPRCDENTQLFIAIKSAFDNFERRNTLRNTWLLGKQCGLSTHASSSEVCAALWNRTKYAFFVSTPSQVDHVIEQRFVSEKLAHRDLVQFSLVEHYHNITLKTVSTLLWTSAQCPQTSYVLSTDDDMLIIVANVWRTIMALEQNSNGMVPVESVLPKLSSKRNYRSNFVGGKMSMRDSVWRDGRYAVSKSAYPSDYWPPFHKGWFVLLSIDAAVSIMRAAMCVRLLRLDDVDLFGILPDELAIPKLHLSDLHGDWEYKVSDFDRARCSASIGVMAGNTQNAMKVWTVCD